MWHGDLTRRNLVVKLLMTKVTRSVTVVMVIAKPACFITYKIITSQHYVHHLRSSDQPHPLVDGQAGLIL